MEHAESKNASGDDTRIKTVFKAGFFVLGLSLCWEFFLMHKVLEKTFGFNECLVIGSGCLALVLRSLFPPISVSAAALVFIGGLSLGPNLIQLLGNVSVGFRGIIFPSISIIIGFLPARKVNSASDAASVEPKSVRLYLKNLSRRNLIGLIFSAIVALACFVKICFITVHEIVGYDGWQMAAALGVFILSGITWDGYTQHIASIRVSSATCTQAFVYRGRSVFSLDSCFRGIELGRDVSHQYADATSPKIVQRPIREERDGSLLDYKSLGTSGQECGDS